MTHTNERPFQCSSCGDAFRTKRELVRHVEKTCAPEQLEEEEQSEAEQREEEQSEEEQSEEERPEEQMEEADQEIDFAALLGPGSVTYVTYPAC